MDGAAACYDLFKMGTHGDIGELSIGLSLVLGAMHAVEPGHGKTALITHLLTERRSLSKPILLAFSTALSHATSILLIASLTHGLLHVALLESGEVSLINHGLHLLSGFLLVTTAIYLLRQVRRPNHGTSHHKCCGCRSHKHKSFSGEPLRKSWRTIALGFAVGLVPCPSALVALSSAITSGRWMQAMFVIGAFSFGIFAALLALGLLLGWKGALLVERNRWARRHSKWMLRFQMAVLLVVGLWHFWLSTQPVEWH